MSFFVSVLLISQSLPQNFLMGMVVFKIFGELLFEVFHRNGGVINNAFVKLHALSRGNGTGCHRHGSTEHHNVTADV